MAHKAFSSGQISDFAILSILSSHGMFSLCTNEALSLITLLPLFLVPRITKPFESTMSMCSFLDTDLTACNHQMWWTLNISLLTTIANLKKKNITLMSWKGNYFNFFSFSGCLGTLSMHYSSGLQHSSSRWVVMPTLSWQKMSSAMRRIRKPYIFFPMLNGFLISYFCCWMCSSNAHRFQHARTGSWDTKRFTKPRGRNDLTVWRDTDLSCIFVIFLTDWSPSSESGFR